MNSETDHRLNESEIDALAVKMLDHYNDGEFAYEANTNKTVKQRNMKRYIKDNLITMGKDASKNVFLNAFYATTMEITQPTKLRVENTLLKKKLKIYETRDENYEALAMTLYKDEIYKRVKSEMDQQLLQNLEDSRWVNQQHSDIIGKLERSLAERKDYVPRERLQELQNHNHELTMEIHKNKKNHKMSAREKKRAALKKQMEELDSSDDEMEIIKVDLADE
tara:strand:- start:38 stop:703 length:666 start_codon:yes stop_codon:yes gene_type:complete